MNAEVILELLKYTSAYVVVLDSKMDIKFINIALAQRLGYNDECELLGRCWLDFIPKHFTNIIKEVHTQLLKKTKNEFHEFYNEVQDREGNLFNIKWINTAINSETNWTFSLGIPQNNNLENVSESDIREQFHSIIKSNKQMIESLKEYVSEIPNKYMIKCSNKTENTF